MSEFSARRTAFLCGLKLALALAVAPLSGCPSTGAANGHAAATHATELVSMTEAAVRAIRKGLPRGATRLSSSWQTGARFADDPLEARRALTFARKGIVELSQPMSTFFAIVSGGVIIRNDQAVDEMAGTSLYEAFPALRGQRAPYREAVGDLVAARAVADRPDAQWVASSDIRDGEGNPVANYITGWSWSLHAQQLENRLRAAVRARRAQETDNMPLLYCFILMDKSVYSAPHTPSVHRKAIADFSPMNKLSAKGRFSRQFEVDGRTFQLAVEAIPLLAPGVGLGVLRSET